MDEYFDWLCGLVSLQGGSDQPSYWELAAMLYDIPFRSKISNDSNRMQDGLNLRDRFADIYDQPCSKIGPCSVLEMMVALADRMTWETSGIEVYSDQTRWFMEMLGNLGLDIYTDDYLSMSNYSGTRMEDEDIVASVIEVMLSRRYSKNGKGGLFPLQNPKKDQRKVEIWYQMMGYLSEKRRCREGEEAYW